MAFDISTVSPTDGWNYYEFTIKSAPTTIALPKDRGGDATAWDEVTDWGDGTVDKGTTEASHVGEYVVCTINECTTRLTVGTDVSASTVNSVNRDFNSLHGYSSDGNDANAAITDITEGGRVDAYYTKDWVKHTYTRPGTYVVKTKWKVSDTPDDLDYHESRKVAFNYDTMLLLTNCYGLNCNMTDHRYMFNDGKFLSVLNVGEWDVSKSTDMRYFFNNGERLTEINGLGGWDVSNVKYMNYMFAYNLNVKKLDVENWDVHNVIDISYMFSNCWELSDRIYTFEKCNSSDDGAMLVINPWLNPWLPVNQGGFFVDGEPRIIFSKDHKKISTSFLGDGYDIDSYVKISSTEKAFDVSKWDTSNLEKMDRAFDHAKSIINLDLTNWKIGKVNDLIAVFYCDFNLESVGNISNWDTSLVLSTWNMFNSCLRLNGLDISNWDVSNLYHTVSMFKDCKSLTTLNLSKWNISNSIYSVIYVSDMFSNCNSLTSLGNLSNLLVSSTTTIATRMFEYCESLEELVIDNWVLESADTRQFLQGNTSLKRVSYANTTNPDYVNIVIEELPDRTGLDPGVITLSLANPSEVNVAALAAKNWNVVWDYDPNFNYYEFTINDAGTTITIIESTGDDPTENSWDKKTDWGDGEVTTGVTHTYANPGVYVVKSKWKLSSVAINDTIPNPNTTALVSNVYMINRNMRNAKGMCKGCNNLTTLDVSSWDVSNITNMDQIFDSCSSLTSLDLSNWDVSNVTDMQYVFSYCDNLKSLDVSNWDVSNVTSMMGTFRSCSSLTDLDIPNWDVSNVTNMWSMFENCSKLTSLDVYNWDVSNVTNMQYMFDRCRSLPALDVFKWDTSSVTDMKDMFNYCESLTSLDVSNWDTSSVTNMSGMFNYCGSLTALDVSNWDVSNVTNIDSTFNRCGSLTALDVSNWDVSNVTSMKGTFSLCPLLTALDVSNWNTSKVDNLSLNEYIGIFTALNKVSNLDVSNWDTSKIISMSSMFDGCSKLTSLDLSNWDVSNVTDMRRMFFECNRLESLDISNWRVKSSVNISDSTTFFGTPKLKVIRLLNSDATTFTKIAGSIIATTAADAQTNPRILVIDKALNAQLTAGMKKVVTDKFWKILVINDDERVTTLNNLGQELRSLTDNFTNVLELISANHKHEVYTDRLTAITAKVTELAGRLDALETKVADETLDRTN